VVVIDLGCLWCINEVEDYIGRFEIRGKLTEVRYEHRTPPTSGEVCTRGHPAMNTPRFTCPIEHSGDRGSASHDL
jgi:hypothetical protein